MGGLSFLVRHGVYRTRLPHFKVFLFFASWGKSDRAWGWCPPDRGIGTFDAARLRSDGFASGPKRFRNEDVIFQISTRLPNPSPTVLNEHLGEFKLGPRCFVAPNDPRHGWLWTSRIIGHGLGDDGAVAWGGQCVWVFVEARYGKVWSYVFTDVSRKHVNKCACLPLQALLVYNGKPSTTHIGFLLFVSWESNLFPPLPRTFWTMLGG